MAFPGQVVLVHGDSHYFKVDQPLTSDKGTVLANFTRVETWGASNVHWVSAEIDPSAPTLFTFRSMIVPADVSWRSRARGRTPGVRPRASQDSCPHAGSLRTAAASRA